MVVKKWNLNTSDARSVDVAWNNAFRKIFKGFWRESVKPLQFYCQCLPVTMLIALREMQFWKKMYYHDSIVSHILEMSVITLWWQLLLDIISQLTMS